LSLPWKIAFPDGGDRRRSTVDQSVATQNVARFRRQLENEPDEFTRSALLKLLLHEAEKSCGARQQLRRPPLVAWRRCEPTKRLP
jgi:hypothetical protein